MKSRVFKRLAFSLALLVSASVAAAQEGGIVAVLDVARVFKENQDFSDQMAAIKAEAEQLKATIQREQEAIRQEAMTLSELPIGTPERKQKEALLEQKQTALRTQARQDEQDLLAKEAGIYYATYTRMQGIVEQIAQQNNISLVLRFDSAPINKDNPNEVVVGVNRAIIYHYKLDLTSMVIKQMGPVVAANPGTPERK